MKTPCVGILATCDTKGAEAAYLQREIIGQGVQAMVIDCGILGDAHIVKPDMTKHDVARMAGYTIEEVIATGSRGSAVEIMQAGVNKLVSALYAEGKLDGLIALGGAEGSVLAAAAMEALPLGVPKLLVSPIASGNHKFNEIVRSNDVMMMHSIVDILGLNTISTKVFNTAILAITGAVKNKIAEEVSCRKKIGLTMLGQVTEPVLKYIMPALEKEGYEVITFHANGVGGGCMDRLINDDFFDASIEYCVNEIGAYYLGGFHVPSKTRMDAAMEKEIPVIITPGGASFIAAGKVDTLTEDQKNRALYHHNPEITLYRVNKEEMRLIAGTIAEKMNKKKKNVKLVFPLKGFAAQDMEGKCLWDNESNMVFLDVMKKALDKEIEIIEVDAHINDREYADVVSKTMISMMAEAVVKK